MVNRYACRLWRLPPIGGGEGFGIRQGGRAVRPAWLQPFMDGFCGDCGRRGRWIRL